MYLHRLAEGNLGSMNVPFFFKVRLFLEKLQAELKDFSNNSDCCFEDLEVDLILCLTSDKHEFWHGCET